MRLFLLATRGLEELVEAEARARVPGARTAAAGYRRVLLEAPPAGDRAALGLRCADDAFLLAATGAGFDHRRRALDRVADLADGAALEAALARVARLRPLARPPAFSVSASFVGRRNYSAPDLKLAVADGVRRRRAWAYREEEAPEALSLRLFLDHEAALLGVRLAAAPLHRRPYKLASLAGSLKPPVAAALASLAGAGPGVRLLDPMCGAGTVAVEAAALGATALAGDRDPEAVAATLANAAAAGLPVEARPWDATALPLPDASVDAVASNLPFGRQILPGADLGALYGGALAEVARVLRPGGRAALLSAAPEALEAALAAAPALGPLERREVSLHGQNPTILLLGRQ